MKFAIYCLLAGSSSIKVREPVEETLVETVRPQMNAGWANWPNTKWAPPQPNFAGAPEKVLVPDPVAYQSRANTPSYLGNRRTTFYGQVEADKDQIDGNWPDTKWAPPQPNFAGAPEKVLVPDPIAYQSRANTPSYLGNRRTTFYGQTLAEKKGTNWPNTKWTPPQPNFAGAPEKVLVPDPVAYQSRANTPSYLGNRRTTFYGQLEADAEKKGTNWPNTKWTPPQPNFAGAPEKVLVPDPVAYQSRANTPSYLGNRRTTFYAQTQGDDQPEGTNQGVNQLTVTQKDKRYQERLFRGAFAPKNVSAPQWNPYSALAETQWGETNVDAMPAATRAFADKATEAGKFASWNKPFANYAQEEPAEAKEEGEAVYPASVVPSMDPMVMRSTFY